MRNGFANILLRLKQIGGSRPILEEVLINYLLSLLKY